MILEEIINEEIHSQIDSGYKESDYVKTLRELLKKFDLKEIYNFDKQKGLLGYEKRNNINYIRRI